MTGNSEYILDKPPANESEVLFRGLFENSSDAIQILDNFTFVECNQVTVEILHAKNKDEVMTTHPSQLSPEFQPDGRLSSEKADEMIRTALEKGGHRFEWMHRRVDGENFLVEVMLTPVVVGSKTMLYSSWRDISDRKRAEAAVRDSEEKLRAVYEGTHDAVMLLDPHDPSGEWPIIDCNTAACTINGYRREELIGQPVNIVNAPTDHPIDRDDYLKQLRGTGSVKYEIFHRRKDGTMFPVETSTTLIKIGERELLLGIDRDITDRKRAEMDILLRDRALASSINAVIIVGLDFKPIYANESFLKLTGYTYEEAMQLSVRDITGHPEGVKRIDEAMSSQGFFMGEEPVKRKDGSIFPTSFSTSFITNDEGQPIAIQSNFIDVTERTQAEAATHDNEERLRAIYEGTNDAIMLLNEQGFFDCNSQTLKMFGFKTKEEFIALHPSDASPASQPDGRDSVSASQEHIQTAYRQGYDRFEWIHRRSNGEDFPAEVLLSAFDFGGQRVLQATVRDITERKQLEEGLLLRDRALASSLSAVLIVGLDFKPIYVNESFLKMTGYTHDEAMRLTITDISGDPEGLKQIDEATQTQGFFIGEEPIKRKDGFVFPTDFFTSYITNAKGEPIAIQTAFTDISKRKQLEAQVREAFERRGLQVQLSTQVSQSIAAASSLAELYERVVMQVKEQFGYYHAQILRYDEAQDAVVLVTGYGETGAKMLAAGHRLPMGEGLIGTAAATGETVLRASLQNDPDWHPNPLLPETKGEIAVPIKLGDNILGVLDVQSNVADALGADDQLLLEGLCGQIATAIEDTRLRQEMARQYQTFYLSIRDGIAHIYLDGKIRACNAAMERLVGYTQDELKQMNIFKDLTPPQWNPMVDKILKEKVMTQGYAEPYEKEYIRKDGTIVPVELSVYLERDEQGQPIGYTGFVRDITERKQAEAQSQQEKSFSDTIINGLPGTFYLFDLQGKMIRWNKQYEMVSGYTPEEIPTMSVADSIAEEDRERVAATIQRAFMEGQASVEANIINRDGKHTPYYLTGQRLQIGDQVYLAGTGIDITERKQAEAQLQQEKSLSDAIINSLPGIFYMFDTEGRLVRWNKNYEHVLGMTAEEVAKSDLTTGMAEEDLPALSAAFEKAFTEDALASIEASMINQSGERLPYYFVGNRVQLGDQVYVLGIGQDITERKQAEQAVRSSQEQLLNIIDFLPDATLVTDKDRKVIAWNRAIEEMTGVKKEDILGKGDYAYSVPFYGEARPMLVDFAMEHGQVADRYKDLQKQGDKLSAEVYVSSVYQGRGGHLLAIASPLYDADGNIVGAIESIRDVTERKKLETQIREAFERRGLQVQLSTQVSQSIAAATSLQELYERVVTQVKEQFGYYHTQLLRYDAFQDAVELVTGYGEVGAKMLAARHHLPMGEGLIGTAAATGETVLRPTLEHDPDWHPNPLLPETKGEIAVPIKLGSNILGVLDVQSNAAGALGADDQLLLEGLCGQIATAIESTRLTQEMTERLEEINRLYRAMSHEGWQTYRETADIPAGFIYDQAGLRPIKDVELAEELFANIPVALPGGEVIGSLAVADDPQHPITPEDEAFLQQISEQVALALESARLFEQTQSALSEAASRALELETVAKLSATTSTELDPEKLLQAVVDLTKERFGLYHAHVYTFDWNTLILAAGAGEVGRKLVAEAHAIPITLEQSLVARAARERKTIIVNDVNNEPSFLPNPLLPKTCAEMAVPMVVGDKLLGIFDVQSSDPAGFSDEDANIYLTLAAQVGVALQNARLYVEQAQLVNELRDLDRLKSSFLANMSHELRTPLNSILGFADVIIEGLDGPLTENMTTDLQRIQRNGQHLLHLINDVLDMAKIEAGRMNLSPENFKPYEIMEEVTSLTSSLASEKNLALFIENDSDQNVEIYADRTRLRQVMINLVNNAIKFTDKGKIAIKLISTHDEKVLITVKDTGIGIPPDKLEPIFQEFTQVDSSSTRKAGGTGLGLPISRRLVEMHGGRLWAESTGKPGEGSTFFVELPVEAKVTEPEK